MLAQTRLKFIELFVREQKLRNIFYGSFRLHDIFNG